MAKQEISVKVSVCTVKLVLDWDPDSTVESSVTPVQKDCKNYLRHLFLLFPPGHVFIEFSAKHQSWCHLFINPNIWFVSDVIMSKSTG